MFRAEHCRSLREMTSLRSANGGEGFKGARTGSFLVYPL